MNNSIKNEFENILCTRQIKNSTKEFLAENIYGKKHKTPVMRFAVSAVCTLIAVFSAAGFGFAYSIPVAAVSVDINPSVELSVNCFDRVVSAAAYDDKSQEIIESVELKNLKYDEAVVNLLNSQALGDYVSPDDFVSVTVSADSNEKYRNMEECLNSSLEQCNRQGECNFSDKQQAKTAKQEQISLGKYREYLKLKEANPEITVDDVRSMTMKEIRQLLGEDTQQIVNGGNQYGKNSGICSDSDCSDNNSNSTDCNNAVSNSDQCSQTSDADASSRHSDQNGSGNGQGKQHRINK